MTIRPWLLPLLFVALGAVGGCGAPEPPAMVPLELTWTKGQERVQRVLSKQSVQQPTGPSGPTLTMEQTLEKGIRFEVTEVSDTGTATLDVRYDWVRVEVKGPGIQFAYDSRESEVDDRSPMALAIGSLVGAEFTARVEKNGTVGKITGVTETLAKILAKDTLPTGEMRRPVEQSLGQHFSEKSIRRALTAMFSIYPTKPVAVNETWTDEFELDSEFPLTGRRTSKLTKVEGKRWTIEANTSVEPRAEATVVNLAGMPVEYNLQGYQLDTIELDATSGWVLRFQGEQKITGRTQSAAGEIPITVETVFEVETVAPEEVAPDNVAPGNVDPGKPAESSPAGG